MPVTRFVAPGPEVAMTTPVFAGHAGPAVGGVGRALLVAGGVVPDLVAVLVKLIVNVQDSAARVAEYGVDTLFDEYLDDDLRACHKHCVLLLYFVNVISLEIAVYNERALQFVHCRAPNVVCSESLCLTLAYSESHFINMTSNPDANNKPEYEYANNDDGCIKQSGHAHDSLPVR